MKNITKVVNRRGELVKFALALSAALVVAPSAYAEKEHSCPELQKDFAEVARACDAAAGVTVSIDGSTTIPGTSVTAGPIVLFGGITPPTGYMVGGTSVFPSLCFVNDDGPAGMGVGFLVQVNNFPFITPKGYTPIGPVSIWCEGINGPIQVEARAY